MRVSRDKEGCYFPCHIHTCQTHNQRATFWACKFSETVVAGLQSTQPAGKSEREREKDWKKTARLHVGMCAGLPPCGCTESTCRYHEYHSLSHALPSNPVSVSDSFRDLMYFPFLGNNSLSWAQSQTAATVSEAFLVLVSQLSVCLTRNTVSKQSSSFITPSLSFFLSVILCLASLTTVHSPLNLNLN